MIKKMLVGALAGMLVMAAAAHEAKAASAFAGFDETDPPDFAAFNLSTLGLDISINSGFVSSTNNSGSLGQFNRADGVTNNVPFMIDQFGFMANGMVPGGVFSLTATALDNEIVSAGTTALLLEGTFLQAAAVGMNAFDVLVDLSTLGAGILEASDYPGGYAILKFGGLTQGPNANDFSAIGTGTVDIIGAKVSTIPLPAGIILLLTAIGGFGFVAHRRKSLTA